MFTTCMCFLGLRLLPCRARMLSLKALDFYCMTSGKGGLRSLKWAELVADGCTRWSKLQVLLKWPYHTCFNIPIQKCFVTQTYYICFRYIFLSVALMLLMQFHVPVLSYLVWIIQRTSLIFSLTLRSGSAWHFGRRDGITSALIGSQKAQLSCNPNA